MVATAKKPAAITKTTTQTPTIPNDIQGRHIWCRPLPSITTRGRLPSLAAIMS
jgi:hypothetical protein